MEDNAKGAKASEATVVEIVAHDHGRTEEIAVVVEAGDLREVVAVVEEEVEALPILIEVNRKRVRMEVLRARGLEIKAAAIAQGVQIELDFLLAIRRHGRTDPVKDAEEVRLHQYECFVANAADDNS
jgi:hypothetical protein